MARLRSNNVFGTTTNNPLAAGGTSLSSAGLANLAAVAGVDRAVITLDPNRVHGAPEIVYVTAHSGGAGTATILRGQEGTAARSHPSGTFWVHGATALDLNSVWDPPAVKARRVGAGSHTANAAWQAVAMDGEDFDTDTMHSTAVNNSRLTVFTAGLYALSAHLAYGLNATGFRGIGFRKNGVTNVTDAGYLLIPTLGAAFVTAVKHDTLITLAVGDFVEVMGWQNSGGSLAYDVSEGACWFSAVWVGSGD